MQADPSGLPDHLAGKNAQGLRKSETIAQFEINDFKNFVYLILDWKKKEAAIVDPQSDIATPLDALEENGFRLGKILLTHTHWDHIAGVPALLDQFPWLEVFVHPSDATRLSSAATPIKSIRPIHDQEKITVGELLLEVLHTPGHSAGECCFFLRADRPYLLTGDTLFIRDCGRTDLESGSTSSMFNSLQRLKKLPPDTVILPGHHYAPECASLLRDELLHSPPLACKTAAELERLP